MTLPDELRVIVNRRHIAMGRRLSCRQCPVALAFTEAIGVPVAVNSSFNWEHPVHVVGHGRVEYDLDNDMPLRHFIDAFDNGAEVQPAVFTFRRVATPAADEGGGR